MCWARPPRLVASCLKALRTSSVFFVPPLRKITHPDTLPANGAEDKALLGSNLSADSGAKTRLGRQRSWPSKKSATGIGINSVKSQGSGDRVPRTEPPSKVDSLRPFRSSLTSALSSHSCLRLRLLQEPIPLIGFRNHKNSLIGLGRQPRLPVRRRKSLPLGLRLTILLQFGENPISSLC